METQFLTFADIKKRFPNLRPSRLDYLVRDGLVECQCSGHGGPGSTRPKPSTRSGFTWIEPMFPWMSRETKDEPTCRHPGECGDRP